YRAVVDGTPPLEGILTQTGCVPRVERRILPAASPAAAATAAGEPASSAAGGTARRRPGRADRAAQAARQCRGGQAEIAGVEGAAVPGGMIRSAPRSAQIREHLREPFRPALLDSQRQRIGQVALEQLRCLLRR